MPLAGLSAFISNSIASALPPANACETTLLGSNICSSLRAIKVPGSTNSTSNSLYLLVKDSSFITDESLNILFCLAILSTSIFTSSLSVSVMTAFEFSMPAFFKTSVEVPSPWYFSICLLVVKFLNLSWSISITEISQPALILLINCLASAWAPIIITLTCFIMV